MKKPIQIYLEEDDIKSLKKLAIDRGVTLTSLIRNKIILLDKEQATVGHTKNKSVPQAENVKLNQDNTLSPVDPKLPTSFTTVPTPPNKSVINRDFSLCKHGVIKIGCKKGCK